MFYYLLKNPATYQTLRKEIDDMDSQRELSPKISFAESNKMPYLLAVCKEAMRLNPSVGLGLPRYVPQGGREICGRFFPEGVSFAFTPNAKN
jgi:cytochrome P450